MNRLRTAAVGTALAATLAGCAPGHNSERVPTHGSPTLESPFDLNQADTQLLDQNAPVNLIYMQPDRPYPTPIWADSDAEAATRKAIIGKSPVLLAGIRHSFDEATYGRYVPKSVSISLAGRAAISCISATSSVYERQDEALQVASSRFNQPGKLNVIVFDQQPCAHIFSPIGGIESMSGMEDPVIFASAFGTTFEQVVMHETGHDGGLEHAGTANCNNPATIYGCELNPTDDPISVMSYSQYPPQGLPFAYSYPELGMLGLMKADEVLDQPNSGEYELRPIGQTGLKVIKLLNDTAIPVYISFEADPSAAFDEKCVVDRYSNNSNDPYYSMPNYLSSGQVGLNGTAYVCLRVNPRRLENSVQVRTTEVTSLNGSDPGEEFLADVTRRQRLPNKFDPHVMPGEIIPGRILFESSKYTVTLQKISNQGASVKIVEKTK